MPDMDGGCSHTAPHCSVLGMNHTLVVQEFAMRKKVCVCVLTQAGAVQQCRYRV